MDYRNDQHIAHDLGTAVNVVTMVFGNMGDDSGTGRRLHARPEHRREDPLRRVPHQRPGRGRRRRHPDRAEDRRRCRPTCPRSTASSSGSASSSSGTTATSRTSSSRSSAASCTCSRPARRSGPPRRPCGSPRTSSTRASSTKEEALGRIEPAHVDQLLRDQFDPAARTAADAPAPRGSTRRPARPSARRCSTRTPRSSGRPTASASCWSGSRRRPTTSTAWPWPRAS